MGELPTGDNFTNKVEHLLQLENTVRDIIALGQGDDLICLAYRVFLFLLFPGDAILDPKISCEIAVFEGKISRNKKRNKLQFSTF